MSISNGLDPYIFLFNGGKDAVYGRRNGRRGVYFPPELAFSSIDNMIKVLIRICILNWRVNNYVSRQGKGINRRNESTGVFV